MRKTSKWIKSFLTRGNKDKERENEDGNSQPFSIPTENPTTPITIPHATPKEKRRWSFRRPSAVATTTKDLNSPDMVSTSAAAVDTDAMVEAENEQNQHAMAVAADTAAAAVTAAAVICLTNAGAWARSIAVEEAAAIKIQAAFRSYLAKRALCALKGLVKLQALVRGQLVRKQATAILRCMQALVTVQGRAQAQRLRAAREAQPIIQRQSIHRKSAQDIPLRRARSIDRGLEENIEIIEMDHDQLRGSSKGRNSHSNHPHERVDPRFSEYYRSNSANSKQEQLQNSPALSALTEMSPRTCSGHFEYSFTTTQSSPQYYSAMSKLNPPTRTSFAFLPNENADFLSFDYPFHPHYMANTESSKAKLRSHSAPKQRSESYERQLSSRRSTTEGNNIPREVRMQRSSSHIGSTVHSNQYPWSIKLDRSSVSLKDSECGSSSTVLTNTSYCRSLAPYEHQGNRF